MTDDVKRIAVVGAGPVGRALATAWQAAGLTVHVAVRDPDDARYDPHRGDHELVALGALPVADATVLAVPGAALPHCWRSIASAPAAPGAPGGARVPRVRVRRVGERAGRRPRRAARPGLHRPGRPGPGRGAHLVAATGMRPVWLGDGDAAADVLTRPHLDQTG